MIFEDFEPITLWVTASIAWWFKDQCDVMNLIHMINKLVQLALWKVANSGTNMAQRAVKSLIAAMITPREWR